MNRAMVKEGLLRYSSPFLNPSEALTVYTDPKTHYQTPLTWWAVAESALKYLEQMELLAAAAAETMPGQIYLEMTARVSALKLENRQLKAQNARQAEMLKALSAKEQS